VSVGIDAAWDALRCAVDREGGSPLPGREPDPGLGFDAPLNAAARELVDMLAPVALAGRRLAIGQIGQSLDGRICTETGDSHYINGDDALVHLHRLRALVDCVLVGVGTVVCDRPRLTVRRVAGASPVRAVLDPAGRAPTDVSPLAAGRDEPRTLHLVGERGARRLPTAAPHVERVVVPVTDAGVTPAAVLEALAAAGCGRVLIEGGAGTLSRFVADRALDRLHVLVAPMLIGSGRTGLELPPVGRLRDVPRPPVRRFGLGDDVLFDVDYSAA
jgi:riboflavin-specific deaminase-like protein